MLSFQWLKARKVRITRWAPAGFALVFMVLVIVLGLLDSVPFLSQEKTFEYLSWMGFLLWVWLSLSQEGEGETASKIFFNASERNSPTVKSGMDSGQSENERTPQERLASGVAPAGSGSEARRSHVSLNILEALGAAVAAYGIVQHMGWDPVVWNPGGTRVFSFVDNADEMAALLGVLLMLSSMRVLTQPTILRWLLIEAELATLFWTYTRSPFVAIALACLLVFSLMLFMEPLRRYLPRFCLLLGIAAATLGLLFLGSRHLPDSQRLYPRNWQNDTSVLGRKYLYKKGMEVLASAPWRGVGVGEFSYAYLPFRQDNPSFYASRLAVAESTHNTFLDVAIELGIPAGIIFISLWISALAALLLALFRTKEDPLWILTWFTPLFAAFLCLQFIYPEVSLEALTGYLLGAGALVAKKSSIEIRWPSKLSVGCTILIGLFFILGIFYSSRVAAADYAARRGDLALNELNYTQAITEYTRGLEWDPWNPLLDLKLGKAYEAAGNPPKALLNYNAAVRIDGRNPFVWADIGRLAAESHWRRRSLSAYSRAISLDPYNPSWHHDAAVAALRFHACSLALFLSQEARRLDPNNVSSSMLVVRSLVECGRGNEAKSFVDDELKRQTGNQELLKWRKFLER